ncbi:MAG: hypothetical protein AAFQ83_06240 [Bacteroidota bacterium]
MIQSSFFTQKITQILLLAGVAFSLFFTACEQENVTEVAQEDIDVVEMDAALEADFEAVDDLSFEALEITDASRFARSYGANNRLLNSPCVTISNDSVNKVLTIDFGTGCTGPDGKTRSGQIVIDYTRRLYWPGATLSIDLVNYAVDSVQIDGTKTFTNLAQNFQDTIMMNVTLTGGSITMPNGATASRDYTRTRTWLRALNPINDQFLVDGSVTGTRFNGNTFSIDITETLVFRRACRLQGIYVPVEGEKFIQRSGRPDVTVDYGDGTCDSMADISANGNTITVDLQN